MKAGRELDAKVAEALGWQWGDTGQGLEGLFPPEGDLRYNIALYGPLHFDKDGYLETMPRYSTSWEGMGVLVEEAKKQGIRLEFSHGLNGGYYGGAYSFDDGEYQIDHSTNYAFTTAPHAVSLVFLMAKGVISNA
ncbi:hypothetical protein ACI7RC_26215 [Brevibacillus sp. B_LB10_24]|uniref:hypothetical protein n=1 Tax=Brevibacillus sp. B_LB10_24 TaxID=3380645 RepID=UPI0038BB1F63